MKKPRQAVSSARKAELKAEALRLKLSHAMALLDDAPPDVGIAVLAERLVKRYKAVGHCDCFGEECGTCALRTMQQGARRFLASVTKQRLEGKATPGGEL